MEWIQPIYNCGHWIPYQVAHTGGVDMLSNPGGDSIVTQWEKIVRYDPEVLVCSSCGFTTLGRTKRRITPAYTTGMGNTGGSQEQSHIPGRLWSVYTTQCRHTNRRHWIAGILFHPNIFEVPQHLQVKYSSFFQTSVARNVARRKSVPVWQSVWIQSGQ